MIVTLTANPALDRTLTVPAPLRVGEVQAAVSAREDAGGKGVNVARVLTSAHLDALAVLPMGVEDPYAAVLRATGIPTCSVPIAAPVRANLAITDPDGVTTKVNLPGAALTDADAAALIAATVEACAGAEWLVLAGSLPLGVADDYYVDVIAAVRSRWGSAAPRIAVDTSGAALAAVVAHGSADLIKPNDEELAELVGLGISESDPVSVAEHARSIVPDRAASALVTLGGAGAVLVTAEGAWFGGAPAIRVMSTVGAGDSSLAGYLIAADADPADRLRTAIRYGAAAASLPGTQAPTPADLGAHDIAVRAL